MSFPATLKGAVVASIVVASCSVAHAEMMTESWTNQLFILSDDSGRGMTIGQQVDLRDSFAPVAMDGQQIADAFKALCLDTKLDPASFEAAAKASSLKLAKRDILLPALKKGVEFRFADFGSDSARASLWTGDDNGLKDRPIVIRSRGALVSSGYGPFKAAGAQCNLDLKVSGLNSVDALAGALSQHLAAQPAKLVSKPGFGDGYWEIKTDAGPARVSFDAVDLKKSAALVHLVIQKTQGGN